MRIVTHNIDEPRNPWDAAEALHDATIKDYPHVYTLQECKGAKRAFVRRFGDDYRVLMSDAKGASLITMVRNDIRIVNERYIPMTHDWIGPKKGLRQDPRVHNLTDINLGGEQYRIYNVHRVWMPKDQSRGLTSVADFNRPAWREEHLRIRRIFGRPGSLRRTSICVGDQNSVRYDRSGYSVYRLAQEVGAEIIETGAAVDWAFLINGTGTGKAMGRIGSDHPYCKIEVTR
jgi:hypothetical protein